MLSGLLATTACIKWLSSAFKVSEVRIRRSFPASVHRRWTNRLSVQIKKAWTHQPAVRIASGQPSATPISYFIISSKNWPALELGPRLSGAGSKLLSVGLDLCDGPFPWRPGCRSYSDPVTIDRRNPVNGTQKVLTLTKCNVNRAGQRP